MGRMVILALSCALALQGCGPAREQVLLGVTAVAAPDVWFQAEAAIVLPRALRDRSKVLALSGGGPDGAFGAGYLTARAEAGCSAPDIVTGVSIGALIATLVFASQEYALRSLFAEGGFAQTSPSVNPLRAITMGTVADGETYRKLVAQTMDRNLIALVAAEHRKGRRLYVATTDLDAMRMTAWDMGAIANLPGTGKMALFHDVIIASASIPGVFPVVPLPNGDGSARLHVDGGVTGQVFVPVLPPTAKRPQVRIIFNNGLSGDPPISRLEALPTVQRGLSTLIRAQSRQQVELARIRAKVAGGQVDAVSIPPDAPVARLQDFSARAMAATFELGRQIGQPPAGECP
ncbi:MAG: patatin-like phospholipase family protein [Hyphomicrobium aestuarii]|nr:patatin-like phospholipase family protein [Hyphomicrobium aestuarii]